MKKKNFENHSNYFFSTSYKCDYFLILDLQKNLVSQLTWFKCSRTYRTHERLRNRESVLRSQGFLEDLVAVLVVQTDVLYESGGEVPPEEQKRRQPQQ